MSHIKYQKKKPLGKHLYMLLSVYSLLPGKVRSVLLKLRLCWSFFTLEEDQLKVAFTPDHWCCHSLERYQCPW